MYHFKGGKKEGKKAVFLLQAADRGSRKKKAGSKKTSCWGKWGSRRGSRGARMSSEVNTKCTSFCWPGTFATLPFQRSWNVTRWFIFRFWLKYLEILRSWWTTSWGIDLKKMLNLQTRVWKLDLKSRDELVIACAVIGQEFKFSLVYTSSQRLWHTPWI